ncbi:hypothetical protein DICVIV_12978 [Dictyocaulus viviparus]|uniref:Uncharacterized protein n=1 Tax=Dictyocaulus viviparus TaxID=29172 RepID=A0A0D8X916_DICVI|nr:hypothetical protein DICVIV_12978 [Dictyocaulus viviparus]
MSLSVPLAFSMLALTHCCPPIIQMVNRTSTFQEFRMKLSPPMSWTFCDPLCGIGDQAVDYEDAYDNALSDVQNAVNDFKSLKSEKKISCTFQSLMQNLCYMLWKRILVSIT